ncbi:MAG: porin family protein [Prevotella sp.]|nr:porin family protein [Prevotella sp.]
MKEQWKKQMQQKMADYQESDIEPSWAELEQILAAKQKARVIPLWGKRVAASVVIFLLAGAGYWILNYQKATSSEETPKELTKTSNPEKESEKDTPTQVSSEKPLIANVMTRKLQTSNQTEPESPMAETEPSAIDNEPIMADKEPSKEEIPASADTVVHPSYPSSRQTVIYSSDLRKLSTSSNRLTAMIYYSNTMASSSQIYTSATQIEIPSQQDPAGEGKDGWIDPYEGGEKGENKDGDETHSNTGKPDPATPTYKDVETRESTHHHHPIRFGFSLRYRLNERWGIESGLTYTRHSSDITKTVEKKFTTIQQQLTYIGIPLNVFYQVWSSRYFNFYLSAGTLVEKMVKGSHTTSGLTTSVSISPLQFSLNTAAGAELKFSRDFSLYAEPMLSYYFDNGSRISIFYQEKPFNYGFNIGLRFNINR